MKDYENIDGRDEIIMVPVPKKFLGPVYGSIADAMRTPEEEYSLNAPTSLAAPNEPGRKEWTEQEIKELKEINLSPTVQVLLDLTAKKTGNWVDYVEIREKAGRERREAQGELSGFSQLLRRKFDRQGQEEWPVQVKTTPQGQTRYSMPHSIARWWKSDWIEDSESLENEIDFIIERCTAETIEYKDLARIINRFTDRLLDLAGCNEIDETRVAGKIMHHINKRVWEIRKDSSCLLTSMQLMFNSSFFEEEYQEEDEDEEDE